jgi:hypothetical protein
MYVYIHVNEGAEDMETTLIFVTQFALSTVVIALIAGWVWRPVLAQKGFAEVMFLLTLPHAFRHLGLVFMVPEVVAPGMPADFALEAGLGDFASGLLAIIVLFATRYRWAVMVPLLWVFNLVGVADLFNALGQADVLPYFRSAWYIPTFVVPLLLVTHFMMLKRLVLTARHRDAKTA